MLSIDESLTAKGYTAAADVPLIYGRKRTIESITIHHWGAFGQNHDGVVNFFVNGPGLTSAHFVCSAGRTNCLVSPLDAAWHAGNPVGNATSVGIECRPECTPLDMQEAAELVAWLREEYGDLPLVPHRYWQATACPGIWDLTRLDALARSINTAAPTTPNRDEKMLIIANDGTGKIWIGDGVVRRHIPSPPVLNQYQALGKSGALNIYAGGAVQQYTGALIDGIGTDVVESVLTALASRLDQ
jgi:hypothetical protein